MPFSDLSEILHEPEPLELPIRGRLYAFPGTISARAWLKLQHFGAALQQRAAAGEADREAFEDMDQEELLRELCGDTLDDMLAHGVTSHELEIVLATLVAFHLSDRETAEEVWNLEGETPAPNRAQRRKNPSRPRGSRSGSTSPKSPKAGAGAKS